MVCEGLLEIIDSIELYSDKFIKKMFNVANEIVTFDNYIGCNIYLFNFSI
jgi:hypothetical protein